MSTPSALPIDAAARCKIPVTKASAIQALPAARHRFPYGRCGRATGDQLIHRRTWPLLPLAARRRWPPVGRANCHPDNSASSPRSRVWSPSEHFRLPWKKRGRRNKIVINPSVSSPSEAYPSKNEMVLQQ